MALNLLTNPPSSPGLDITWTNFVAREDVAAIGGGVNIRIFTLTNGSTTARPLVAQGSIIEVGGSWYQADSDTALTDDGGLSDGTVHIKLVPGAGTPDPATVIPTLTSDVIPAWDAEKGGWYDSADKFLPFEMERSGAITKVYTAKCEWINQNTSVKICNDGSGGLDGSLDVGGSGTFGSGVSVGGTVVATNINTGAGAVECYAMDQDVETSDDVEHNTVEVGAGKYYDATGPTYNQVFDALSGAVPVVGQKSALSGMFFDTSIGGENNQLWFFSRITRTSATIISLRYIRITFGGVASASGDLAITDGDATVLDGIFTASTSVLLP